MSDTLRHGTQIQPQNSSTRTCMKKRKTYTGSFKAKVVLELIDGRNSLTELASQYRLHPNQIKNWKSQFLKQATYIFQDKRKNKKQNI
jgi:transposase